MNACTRRVKGHTANSAMPHSTCTWKLVDAAAMAPTSGCRIHSERNHGETVSR